MGLASPTGAPCHALLPIPLQTDGRLFVTNKGRQRFAVKSVIRTKPVLLCEVQLLEEDLEEEKKPEVRCNGGMHACVMPRPFAECVRVRGGGGGLEPG
jgi:hypothetical protein